MRSNNSKQINKKNWRKPRPPLPPRPPPPNPPDPPNPTTNAIYQLSFRFTLRDFFKKCVFCCPSTTNQSHLHPSN